MKRLYFILLATLFTASCSENVIHISCDKEIGDYTPVVREILESHPGGISLSFDEGVYPFYPEKAVEKYVAISNNDNSVKRIAFLLEGRKRTSISGKGSEFLFHGGMMPFLVMDCEDVTVSGIRISYDHPFVLEGTVMENNQDEKSFTMRIEGRNLYSVKEGMLMTMGYDWEFPLGENIVFDAVEGCPLANAERYEGFHGEGTHCEDLGDNIVRISNFNSRVLPPAGSIYVDKGPHGSNRLYPAIAIQDSKDISLQDITIHDSGAMSLIAENSRDIRLHRFCTSVKEGQKRMIASSADATHFVGCTGRIEIKECLFESMLDDAVNIHGTYMKADSVLTGPDNAVLHCSFGHFQQEGFRFGSVGDTLGLVDRSSLRSVGTAVLRRMDVVDENHYILDAGILSGTIPEDASLAVENLSASKANVLISGCTVRKNRARSLLLSTGGRIIVEGCNFASMMAGIRICGDANYWYESGRTDRIIIRGNTFHNLGNGGWSPQAVLQIDPVIPSGSRDTGFCYHKEIHFENNIISSAEDQIIYALSVGKMTVRGNSFIRIPGKECRYPGLAMMDFLHCRDVEISGNSFGQWPQGAFISSHGCDELEYDGPYPVMDRANPYFYEN
ncbi:MAG: right-handed parallel beta-helix repeat-containing protein [Candidatus Cryptobacteroides sp.]